MLDGTNVAVITSFVIALLFNNSYSSKMLNLLRVGHSTRERAFRNIFILKCWSNVSKILNRLFWCFTKLMGSRAVVNDYNVRPLRVGPCQNRLRCSTNTPEYYLHHTASKYNRFSFLLWLPVANTSSRARTLHEAFQLMSTRSHFDVFHSAEFNLISWCIEFVMKEWHENSIYFKKGREKLRMRRKR